MRWKRGSRSEHVEDRRGRRTRSTTQIGRLPLPGGGLKLGTIGLLIAAVVIALNYFGVVDLGLGFGGADQASNSPAPASSPGNLGSRTSGHDSTRLRRDQLPSVGDAPASEEELVDFIHFLVDDIQGMWKQEFRKRAWTYRPAILVLFRDAVQSACGMSSSAVGPFYCSLDEKIYIDLSFYKKLAKRFKAPGDFAQAYVIAHEFGHHIQHLRGTDAKVRQLTRATPTKRNELSIKQELQADCYAGMWGHFATSNKRLEPGDLKEGLRAASAIGDDAIQETITGQVRPETWTHGSSEQRLTWFERGIKSGDLKSCDTFQ